MKYRKIVIGINVISVFFFSCIKQVDIARRIEKPILVVEGGITTDTVPYTVRLTYSGPYKYALEVPDEFLEKDARVTITDDLGDQTQLVYTGKGLYQTVDRAYIGRVGRTYRVIAELSNGKRYVSIPEKINPPVPVESYSVSYDPEFNFIFPSSLQVSVNARDPAGQENYYRWTFYSWLLRQTKGVGCGFGCIMFEYCYQINRDKEVRILSDASINGNDIRDRIVGKSYIYTYGDHFIDIGQHSLTREAFQFWERYEAQVSRSGTTLDPLPAPVKGNVFNVADSADFALGYFSASSVTHKRAVVIPYSITSYLLELTAHKFIPDEYIACFDYIPESQSYPPPPARQYPPPVGWENADTVRVSW